MMAETQLLDVMLNGQLSEFQYVLEGDSWTVIKK